MERGGYICIVANKTKTVLYIGVASKLRQRVYDHQSGKGSYFTIKYKCTELLYYEGFQNIEEAIQREKVLEKWDRKWKNELIMKLNPSMKSLNKEVLEERL